MIYLFILSLVSVLCATEVTPTFAQEAFAEKEQTVRKRVVGSTAALSQSASDYKEEAPATAVRPWSKVQVVSNVGMAGLVAYTMYQYGPLAGGLSAIWFAALLSRR